MTANEPPVPTFESAHVQLSEFSRERDWHQFHSPRNLVLALTGEVGEVSALLQWVGDDAVQEWLNDDANRHDLSMELADVLSYLVLLSDAIGIDLPSALAEKIAINHARYPLESSRGSARKYTDL